MTETDLSNEIKKALDQQTLINYNNEPKGAWIKYDYMRLESHSTLQGLPDANLCVEVSEKDQCQGYGCCSERVNDTSIEIWLELKIGSEKPRPLQISWARRRWELGQHNIYCIRGYKTLNSQVAAYVEPMNIYWAEYKSLPSMVMTMDRLAYFLLTGEEYNGK